ncbi:hypothetical protein P4284_07820 [Bacillus swezeyi]|uniref:hypothetical protein n=1 Tax=Bacillus swezeyi TaxID=1925020 RepID=UPI002E213CCB|nr:hypothetical protein [Bacillus swezeyi]
MDSALWGALINAITTLGVGIGISFFGAKKLEAIKSTLSIETQQRLEFLKRKREVYEDFCKGLQYFITGRIENQEERARMKSLALETYDKLSLWASDDVCKAADKFMKEAVKEKEADNIEEKYKALLLAMREDLNANDHSDHKRDYQIIS